MLLKFTLRDAIELTGITAVVISLGFVTYELRLSSSIASSEGYIQVNEVTLGLRELIVENSDVWERGCRGEDLTLEEETTFSNIANFRVFHGFTLWGRAGAGVSNNNPDRIVYRMALNRYLYPGVNEVWNDRLDFENSPFEQFTRSNWASAVEEQYQLLIDSNAERKHGSTRCGW